MLIKNKPLLVVFDVTKRCNSRCSMCSIWRHPSKPGEELNIKEVNRIFKDLKSFGLKHVFIQGGEPLLRTDILEIINSLIVIGFKPTLITNGLLLNNNLIKKLSKMNCNVGISLDSLDRETYKRIRGVDGLNVVLKNINYASKIKTKKGVWGINSTISKVNYSEALSLFNFAINNRLSFQAFPYNYGICKSSAKDDKLVYDNEINEIKEVFLKLSRKARSNGLFFESYLLREAVVFLKGDYRKPCDALKHSIMINEKGELSPCLEMKSFANLRNNCVKDSIKKIDYQIIKDCYNKTPCFYGCTRALGVIKSNLLFILPKFLLKPEKIRFYSKYI